MSARLRYESEPGETRTLEITGAETVIGRDPQANLSLRSKGLSRRHARIVADAKSYFVEDLESTNGTFLNGRPVKRQRLQDLYVITLGRALDIVFMLGGAVETEKRPGIVGVTLVPLNSPGGPQEIMRGEITLGRGASCGLVVENDAVSKLHAKIEFEPTILILRDLRSSNGTFVNGVRVQTAPLRHGDVISLAAAVEFRVELEAGEVRLTTGRYQRPEIADVEPPTSFSGEWKTRFEWGSGELRGLQELQERLAEEDRQREARQRGGEKARARAAAPAQKTPAKPVRDDKTVLAAPVSVPRPTPPPKPEALPDAKPAAKPEAKPPRGILEVRLAAPGVDLSISAPGRFELGRTATLRIDHATVSRRHALIALSEDRQKLVLEDLGAANRVRRNGAIVDVPQPLADGDTITLGAVTLTVSVKRG